VLLLVIVAVRGDAAPAATDLLPAVFGSVAGTVALAAFYRALSIGTMSIVAPVSATGAVLPVIAGIASGDRPSALQLTGIGAAIVGVVLASREAHEDEGSAHAARLSIGLALVAALGFGSFLTLIESAAQASVPWALLVARVTSVSVVAAAALALRPRPPGRADLPALALVGVLDLGANGLYAAATTEGLLSIVGVLGSLYPVTTVVLARAVLGERLRRVQDMGIALTLCGVALIAAG
jgi:drug/metabolite transporter (DMT)-like permease